jgi:hypothetical protein
MPFFIVMLICAAIGVAVPGFTKFLNWFILFPIATVSFGSLVFATLLMFTNMNIMSINGYLTVVAVTGLPFGLWATKESLA